MKRIFSVYLLLLALALCLLLLPGSAGAGSGGIGPAGKPAAGDLRFGVASFYGRGSFRLASGRQAMSERDLFVAHRSLPFNTRVLFQRGGRKVIATVLDRGPYISGRDWDLSWRAARELGLLSAGEGRVGFRILGRR